MPGAQKRLGELNALMAAESFWNNRESAQKLIDEANTLRGRIEPLLKAEKELEDFRVMVELGEAEPAEAQPKLQQELEADLGRFFKALDALELKVFLSGPYDRNNCIVSINAGAGGTESCDWANMLMRMYQRWAEGRGWQVELNDVLPGETRRHQERHPGLHRRVRLRLLQGRARRPPPGAHLALRRQQTPPHQLRQRGRHRRNRGNRR